MRAAHSSPAMRRTAAAVALIGLSVLSAWGVTRLTLDDDLRIASRVVNPKWVRLEQLFWTFGSFDTDIIAVLESDDFFTVERGEALRKLTVAIEAQPPTGDTSEPSPSATLSTSGTPSPSAAPTTSAAPSPTGAPPLPGTPSLSGRPSLSGTPSLSGAPSLSGQPSLSGVPSPPATPSPTGKPSLSGAPTLSGTPKLSGTPSLSGTPAASSTPSASSPSSAMSATTAPNAPAASGLLPPADPPKAATLPPIADTQSMVDGRRFQGKLPIALFPDQGMTEATLEKTREVALSSPLIFRQTISDDGHTTLVLVRLNEQSYQDAAEVERLRDFVEKTARELMEPVGVKVRMTGTPAVRVEVIRSMRRDLLLYVGAAIGAALAVAMVLLRSIIMPLAATAAAALGLLWTLGFAGLANITVDVMTIDLMFVLGVTTFTGALFAQLAGRRAREAGADDAAAVARSVWATGVAEIAIAAGSTCWLWSDGIGVAGLGTLSAVGSLAGLAAVALAVPPLALLGSGRPSASTTAARVLEPVSFLTTARAGIIGAIGLAATAAAAYFANRARPDLHLEDNLPTRGEYAETMRHCGRAMGGVYHIMVIVRLPEGDTLDSPTSEAVHRELQALFLRTDPLKNPLSLVNVVEGMPGLGNGWGPIIRYVTNPVRPSVKMFLNLESRESLATARIADIGTDAVEEVGRRLDVGLDKLRKEHPGYDFELTGMPIVAARALNGSLRKLVTVTAIGLAAAFVALAIGLRSLGGAAVVVAAGLFALAVTVGAMALPGESLNYGNCVVPQLAAALSIVCATQFVSAAQEPSGSIPSPSLALRGSTVALVMFLAGSALFPASEIYCRRAFGVSCCIALAAALLAQWVFVPALTRLLVRPPAPAGS